MREVDPRAERLLARPVEIGDDGFLASALDQAYQERGRKNSGHLLKLGEFAIHVRHGFFWWHLVLKAVAQTRFQVVDA